MFAKQIILVASVLAARVSASCLHGTSMLKRRELPGGRVEVSNFGYTGLQGPLNWVGLAAENSACASGKAQSPINIDASIGLAAEAPVVEIPNVQNAEFENLGTAVEVIVNGTTTFAGTQFSLKQFHFHTPSEHRVAEEYFPLEMHMVHEAADGSGAIAVIAVTFQLSEDGSTTELLTAVTENLAQIETPGTVTETGALDFTELTNHIQTTPLFQYTGSLTTPPCAEGITFLVTQQSLALNVATYNAMKRVVKFNSRYTQNTLGESNLLEVGVGRLGCASNGTVEGGNGEEEEAAVTTSVVEEATSTAAEHVVTTTVAEANNTTSVAMHETAPAVQTTSAAAHETAPTETTPVAEATSPCTTAPVAEATTSTVVKHVMTEAPMRHPGNGANTEGRTRRVCVLGSCFDI